MIAVSKRVEIRKDLPSATIILNRPEQHNALAIDMIDALQQSIEDFQNEKSIRGIILTGSGETFSAGTDLHEMADTAAQPDALEIWQAEIDRIQLLIETLLRCPKPIVAALNGDAIGLGAVLALCADFVVGTEESRLWFPEPQRGLSSNLGAAMLSFRAGPGVATGMIYSGEPLPVQSAVRYGLMHEVVPADLVWAKAQSIVQKFSETSAQANALSKRFINETLGETLFMQLSIALAQMAAARTTDSAREGLAAFIEKRPPQFPS